MCPWFAVGACGFIYRQTPYERNRIPMKKITAVILAFVMCFGILCSCSDGKKENVISIEDGKGVSINFIYLVASMNKTMYSQVVAESSGGNWNQVVFEEEDKTWSDLLMDVVLEDTQNLLICEYLYDNVYGLELTKEDELVMDEQFAAYESAAGGKTAFSEMLSAYSADTETFERYLELVVKQLGLQNHLYGIENGVRRIDENVIKQTFADGYAIVTHIYFNTVTKENPSGQLISLTEEEAAEKRTLAESVYNMIMAGEDFYVLKEQYTEDLYESEYYPNGFFVTNDSTFPAAFTTAALEMAVGDYKLVDSGNGLHILYKLPMDESLYNSNEDVYSTIYSRLMSVDYSKLLNEHIGKIRINDEGIKAIGDINIQNIPEFAIIAQ